MFRKHCSDDRLIAYLDGELGFLRRSQVQRHLCICWLCRTRRERLEEQVRHLADCYSQVPPRAHVDAARARFHAWASADPPEDSFLLTAPPRWRFARIQLLAGCATVGVLAAVAVYQLNVGPTTEPVRPSPPFHTHAQPPIHEPAPALARAASVSPASLDQAPLRAPIPAPVERFSADTLRHAEVQALWIVHTAGLCYGKAVTVSRNDDGILVAGLVDSAEIRAQLASRLENVETPVKYRLEFQSLRHADALAGSRELPISGGMQVRSGPAPAEKILKSAGLDPVGAANRAITIAENAWSEAWAWRSLNEHFPADAATEKMLPADRRMVDVMLLDHASRLRDLASQEGTVLKAVLPRAKAPAQETDPFASAEEMQKTVEDLFVAREVSAGSGRAPQAGSRTLERLLADLSDAIQVLQTLPEN